MAPKSIMSRVCSSIPLGKDLCAFRTASLLGSRMQSRRRSTTKGRITLPYSDCLKSPRSVSAICQTKFARVLRLLGCLVVHSDPCFLALVSRAVAKDRAPARQNAKRQTNVLLTNVVNGPLTRRGHLLWEPAYHKFKAAISNLTRIPAWLASATRVSRLNLSILLRRRSLSRGFGCGQSTHETQMTRPALRGFRKMPGNPSYRTRKTPYERGGLCV